MDGQVKKWSDLEKGRTKDGQIKDGQIKKWSDQKTIRSKDSQVKRC